MPKEFGCYMYTEYPLKKTKEKKEKNSNLVRFFLRGIFDFDSKN